MSQSCLCDLSQKQSREDSSDVKRQMKFSSRPSWSTMQVTSNFFASRTGVQAQGDSSHKTITATITSKESLPIDQFDHHTKLTNPHDVFSLPRRLTQQRLQGTAGCQSCFEASPTSSCSEPNPTGCIHGSLSTPRETSTQNSGRAI
eukprot:scaffold2897_cov178-Amphora_coffeaeformis.AAC.19